jgi:lambda family phage minor tail protein L
MPSAVVNAQADIFNPSALLALYELDSRYVSAAGQLLRFHAGVNGLYQPLVFNGLTYTPFPIEVTEVGIDGKGQPVRPKLTASNINGFMSAMLLQMGDLVGARFTRRRVFARFIDGVNFANGVNPFGTPDPTAAYDDEIFFVSRKVTENPDVVQLETTSPFEIDNVQLPRRPLLANGCPFVYRDGETCGYKGVPVSDRFGKLFTAAAPGGYGYTLSDKGIWSAAVNYQIGDYVTIISQGDYTFGDIQVYVCSVANTTGSFNNPQFNQNNWIADACPHNLLGCLAHFSSGPLPMGGMPGVSRASYQ